MKYFISKGPVSSRLLVVAFWEWKVICGFLTVQRPATLSLVLFKGQLYLAFALVVTQLQQLFQLIQKSTWLIHRNACSARWKIIWFWSSSNSQITNVGVIYILSWNVLTKISNLYISRKDSSKSSEETKNNFLTKILFDKLFTSVISVQAQERTTEFMFHIWI